MIVPKNSLQKTLALVVCLIMIPFSFALTLQEAKQQGVIGEQRDGYIGYVVGNVSAEVRAMVENVNGERMQRYRQIARENNITVEQVQTLAFEQAAEATRAGHFLQNTGGEWVKK